LIYAKAGYRADREIDKKFRKNYPISNLMPNTGQFKELLLFLEKPQVHLFTKNGQILN
jgi:hypothetical protein